MREKAPEPAQQASGHSAPGLCPNESAAHPPQKVSPRLAPVPAPVTLRKRRPAFPLPPFAKGWWLTGLLPPNSQGPKLVRVVSTPAQEAGNVADAKSKQNLSKQAPKDENHCHEFSDMARYFLAQALHRERGDTAFKAPLHSAPFRPFPNRGPGPGMWSWGCGPLPPFLFL